MADGRHGDVLGARYGAIDSRELRKRIGTAGSAVEGSLRDDLTPVTLVMTARHAATEPWWHVYDEDDRARARGLLERLGVGRVADHAYGTLSAGERRRTSIARALMPDPDLLLLDEPTASLDLGARERLVDDLAALAGEARPAAIVLVSHHVEEIPPGFSHALVLADGQVVAAGPLDDVLRARRLQPGVRPADRRRATRGTRLGAHGRERRREPLTRDTRMSHRTPMMQP